MRKIIKKANSKLILLFLLGFFSVGLQAQYNENGQPAWSATAVGQLIANALTTSGSWQSAQSFFVRDQEGNFVRIDFALEEVVVSRSSSINFKFSEDEENLFIELLMLEPLTPEEQIQAHLENSVIPNCPSGYEYKDGECVLLPRSVRLKCENATLSDHTYYTKDGVVNKSGSSALPPGTTLIPQASVPTGLTGLKLTDTTIGFNSALYKVDNGNGKIEYVYATQGTDPFSISDWLNNGQQTLGYISEQYRQSVENARILQKWAADNNYTLSFTGHSLGGGMANANALATGLKATIYNPAGLSDGTINDPKLNLNLSNSSNVTAFVVLGEPVSIANYAFETPVRGTTKYIGSATMPVVIYGASILLRGSVKNGLLTGGIIASYLHPMDSVKLRLDCD